VCISRIVTFHFALQQQDKNDTFAMQQDRFAMQQGLLCSAAGEKEHQKEVLQNTNGTSWLSKYTIISRNRGNLCMLLSLLFARNSVVVL